MANSGLFSKDGSGFTVFGRKMTVMKQLISLFVFLILTFIQAPSEAEDMIVYTANQGWFSRIYAMDMSGNVITYHEYEYYIFNDVEVVDGEVYVTDWVAPRLYKVDPLSGDLEVIVDDWNLLSMYDVAWDGTHFYIDEWNLNRYDIDGDWSGSTSSPGSVRGSAWDGEYYWTLNSDAQIQCWDFSTWPTMVEIQENAFLPPSTDCKGLWFDGEYFWTAESQDTIGRIYRFDYEGQIIQMWLEPAFSGYAACVVPGPLTLTGEISGNELLLEWIPHPEAAAYWIYGAENDSYFEPGVEAPFIYRVAISPPFLTSWSTNSGIGSADANWSYIVVAVDDSEQEIARSNRLGEFDMILSSGGGP